LYDEVRKICLHDYSDVNELTDSCLIKLIYDIIDIDEVPNALYELQRRKGNFSIDMAKNIIINKLGDEFLQGAVIEFIFEFDKQFVVNYTEKNLECLNYYVFGCIINLFAIEAKQLFGENLSKIFLQNIINIYNDYDKEQKRKIEDKFCLFLSSYKDKIGPITKK